MRRPCTTRSGRVGSDFDRAFEAFGVTLLPILAAAGVEMNEPMVARVHNEIKG
jgi:hypothetical protein